MNAPVSRYPTYHLVLSLLLLSSGLLFSSCDDDDACAGASAVSTDFIVGYNFQTDENPGIFPLDTFRDGSYIEFQALDTNTRVHRWRLENDPQVFEGAYQRILFDDGISGNITVSLVADDRSFFVHTDECLTEAQKMDSIAKVITIIPVAECAIIGTYRGYRTSNPADTFEVEVRLQEGSNSWYELTNFPNECTRTGNVFPLRIGVFHRHIVLPSYGITVNDDCPIPQGFGFLDEEHKNLTINFDIYERATNSRISDQFLAVKVE
ncbi:MAG: hypothetical protein AAGJ82_00825 [Bacteroidota bacterium]